MHARLLAYPYLLLHTCLLACGEVDGGEGRRIGAAGGAGECTSKADLSWYPPAGTSKQIHHEPNQPEQLIRPHKVCLKCVYLVTD